MRRAHRSWLPIAVAALTVLVALPSFATSTDAATSKWVSKCETRIRTSPKTSAATLKIIPKGATVTATGTVTGGWYKAACPDTVKGYAWLKIVAINGKSTTSMFGRSYVYAAAKLFKSGPTATATPKPTPTPTPKPTATLTAVASTTGYLSNCSVRLRSSSSTSATTRAIIAENTAVTVASKVNGGSWSADCRTSVSGSTWYKITAVGGKSVSSLYGVSAVYAASGLFRVTTTTAYREGIDVSHWQGTIDWAKVKGAGKQFVFAKASEGIGFEDDMYDRNKAGAMGQGLKFGAYHFARPGSNDPVKEADWFVSTMGLQRGMLLPVLDIEVTGGLGPTALTNWVKSWLQRVYERTGARAIIYTSPSFWRSNLDNSRWFADNGYAMLWVAHWGVTSPSMPADNWGGKSWTFWQYSSDGTVPGISGRVDLNRYRFTSFDGVTY
ncbi:MAG TPA: glycoside hydrolase family 25 protein [Candidatus Limnocylindrales bacterium]|nr:glycoside hydrolase family 25 protein [Candidatus Limnocylindrales bacterium]